MRGKIQLAVRKLDWHITTHTLFSHVSHLPWSMLLDSGVAQDATAHSLHHADARFDIVLVDPIATLVTQGMQSRFTLIETSITEVKDLVSELCPLDLLSQLQHQLYPKAFPCSLPFSGGSVGSFSYDLGRRLEKLPEIAMNDIDLSDMNVGFYDFCLIYSHEEKSWYGLHYSGESALNLAIKKIESKIYSRFQHSKIGTDFRLTSDWQCQLTEDDYQQKFARVQEYLLSGDCYQINLTQRFSASYQGDEWQAYQALSKANRAPFSAFIRLENHCLLSISPERFIKLEGDIISTKPIKGTQPRGANLEDDKRNAQRLMDSEKDRAENVMIVDLLRNDISKVAQAGSVAVPSLFAIESFPAVHHLVSTVTAKLAPEYQPSDLLKAAFPGGSITGAPKIRAMQIIEELEPSRRSLYCGSIGYISQDGNMDTSITIRTLVSEKKLENGIETSTVYCWAGGGIVADSKVQDEYQESFDKVSKILPILSQL